MLEGIAEGLIGRTFDSHVRLKASPEVNKRIRELLAQGWIPVGYANHEGHQDGLAAVVIGEHFKTLAQMPPADACGFKGFAVPMAISMASGGQSAELTRIYDFLKEVGQKKGAVAVPITRRKDETQYGMSKKGNVSEVRPFVEKLHQGYGIWVFPEGSIQGGRHPNGASIEQIYGMQEVRNTSLMDYFHLADRIATKIGARAFLAPVGLHGSYRIMECPEGGKPKLTPQGKVSLFIGMFGLALVQIQANLLMPYTVADIQAALGENWMEDLQSFNQFAMKKIVPGIPAIAAGVYGESVGAPTLELSPAP